MASEHEQDMVLYWRSRSKFVEEKLTTVEQLAKAAGEESYAARKALAEELRKAQTQNKELEQQLAQAQKQIEQLRHAGSIDSASMWKALERAQAEQATMRGLLELFAADEAEPVFGLSEEQNDGYECLRCDSYIYSYEPGQFPHAPECPWLRARAFFAAHPKQ